MTAAARLSVAPEAAATVRRARGWVLDLDGCLVHADRPGGERGAPFPGARELVAHLKARGDRLLCCTNASHHRPETYAGEIRRLGFDIDDTELVTAGWAAARYIAAHHPGARVLALGAEGITAPLTEAGLLPAGEDSLGDVVLVGVATGYPASAIDRACQAVAAGAPLYATAGARWFHGGGARSTGIAAAIAAAISWVTGTAPTVLGKPSDALARLVLDRLELPGDRVAVVGDSDADMQLASAAGAAGVLVLSGAIPAGALPGLAPGQRPLLAVAGIEQLLELVSEPGPGMARRSAG